MTELQKERLINQAEKLSTQELEEAIDELNQILGDKIDEEDS